MKTQEYWFNTNKPDSAVDLSKLTAAPMNDEQYMAAVQGTIIMCHDVYIRYNDGNEDGIMLITRKNEPANGLIWPIGGRMMRGIPSEESMIRKAKVECGLDLENLVDLGHARVGFNTSSKFGKNQEYSHDKGTDSFAVIYYAEGKGTINLDRLHEKPLIVTPEKYTNLRPELHPYVSDFMDIIFHQGVFEKGKIISAERPGSWQPRRIIK